MVISFNKHDLLPHKNLINYPLDIFFILRQCLPHSSLSSPRNPLQPYHTIIPTHSLAPIPPSNPHQPKTSHCLPRLNTDPPTSLPDSLSYSTHLFLPPPSRPSITQPKHSNLLSIHHKTQPLPNPTPPTPPPPPLLLLSIHFSTLAVPSLPHNSSPTTY